MDDLIRTLAQSGPGPILILLILFFIALSIYSMHYVYADMREKKGSNKEDQKSLSRMALDLHDMKNSLQLERAFFSQVRDDVKSLKDEQKLFHKDTITRLVILETVNNIRNISP